MDKKSNDESKNKETGLDSFIEENYRLLAVFGIFGALSIYLADIESEISILENIGSFSSFLIFLLVGLEIWGKALMIEKKNLILAVFEIAMLGIVIAIGGYLYALYKGSTWLLLFMFLFGFGSGLAFVSYFYRKFIYKKIENKKSSFKAGLFIFMAIIFFGFYKILTINLASTIPNGLINNLITGFLGGLWAFPLYLLNETIFLRKRPSN